MYQRCASSIIAVYYYADWPTLSLLYMCISISCLWCLCLTPFTFVLLGLNSELLKASCCSYFDMDALLLVIGKPTWVFKLLLAAWTLRWWHRWMDVCDVKQLILGTVWCTELSTFRPHMCCAAFSLIWPPRSQKSEGLEHPVAYMHKSLGHQIIVYRNRNSTYGFLSNPLTSIWPQQTLISFCIKKTSQS